MNATELLREVTFLAPPITIHQADRIGQYLHASELAELTKMGRTDLSDQVNNLFAWHVAKQLVRKADGGKKDV